MYLNPELNHVPQKLVLFLNTAFASIGKHLGTVMDVEKTILQCDNKDGKDPYTPVHALEKFRSPIKISRFIKVSRHSQPD